MLYDVITILQHQINAGGFRLEHNLAADLPPLMADGPALRRAVQNLISNAMKYGGDDGWVGLDAEVVAADHGRELQIRVSDHGAGIDPHDLPHVFEPFYRGRDVAQRQIYGSGLGLSLVQDTLVAHGGRVSVASDPDNGSCFCLHLPLPAEPLPRLRDALPA